MNYKLVYHGSGPFQWGVAIWIVPYKANGLRRCNS